MNGRTIALIVIIIIAVENAFVPAISKKGLEEIPSLTFAALRFFLASLCLLPFVFQKKEFTFSNMREIAPTSLFATVNVIFFVLGIKLTTGNMGSIIYAAVPLLSSIILYCFFKERLSQSKAMGVLIGFVGVLIVTLLPLLEKGNVFAGNFLGNIFLATAVISWSFYMVYSKLLHKKYSPFMVTSNFIFVSAVAIIPFLIWDTWQHFGWWNHLTGLGIFSLLYMGIAVTIIGYLLQQYAIKHGGSIFAGTTFYVGPILAFIANYWLLGEQLTIGFAIGTILALAGTYLVMKK